MRPVQRLRTAAAAATCCMTSPALAHGISDAARQRMLEGGDFQYMILGAEHMVTGLDHLLFLFGVMFFLTRFGEIVKFVTAFTIGHTITLLGATWLGITVNYFLVDAIIALTVIYKAFENLDGFRRFLNSGSPNLLFMVFLFGLIHGFGLSTRLQQLPIREDAGLLMHILSFNVGVELGQIAALIVMFIALRVWRGRPSFGAAAVATNVMIGVAGLSLFLLQSHGLAHAIQHEDLAFNHDEHRHAHDSHDGSGDRSHGDQHLPSALGDHRHNADGSHPPGVPDHGPAPAEHRHNADGSHPPGVPDHGSAQDECAADDARCRLGGEAAAEPDDEIALPDHF